MCSITESGSENWLYWTPLQLVDGELAGGRSSIVDYVVDTKAMRRFGTEMSLYAAIEMETEEGTATSEFWFDSRLLALLP